MRIVAPLVAAVLFVGAGSAAWAQAATLTITDGRQTVELDPDDLAGLKQEVIETATAWTEGRTKFSGPSLSDVLEEGGLSGETVTAEARDGYSVEIPRARLTGDGANLATSMNDAPLPEDKAPFWILFPYDRSPEMNDADHQSWSAWAVTKLTVK
jgi:hypothetical protein